MTVKVRTIAPLIRTLDTRTAKPPPKKADAFYLTAEWRAAVEQRIMGRRAVHLRRRCRGRRAHRQIEVVQAMTNGTDIPSMVERVARAICLSQGLMPDNKYRSSRDGDDTAPHLLQWHDYQPEARAAIAAMREPTAVMGDAFMGHTSWQAEPHIGDEWYGDMKEFSRCWGEALDAALTEAATP